MNHRFYIWLAGILFVIIVASILIISNNMNKNMGNYMEEVRDKGDKELMESMENKDMEMRDEEENGEMMDNKMDGMKSEDKGTVRNNSQNPSNNNAAVENTVNELDDLVNSLGSEFDQVESDTDVLQGLGSDTDTSSLGDDLNSLSQ